MKPATPSIDARVILEKVRDHGLLIRRPDAGYRWPTMTLDGTPVEPAAVYWAAVNYLAPGDETDPPGAVRLDDYHRCRDILNEERGFLVGTP